MKLQESMTGFYYIGSNRANISKLVHIYQRGYASGNLRDAFTELTRENHLLPEVIFCESGFGFEAITYWAGLLSKKGNLAQVPFIIDADKITAVENHHFINSRVVDDILNMKDWDDTSLCAKIRFVRKFKNGNQIPKEKTIVKQLPGRLHNGLKRAFDIVVSFSILIFLMPLLIIIAFSIWIESGGAVFYISQRAGRGYRIFKFYKFRTMVHGADGQRNDFAHLNQYQDPGLASFFKIENDPRITRTGRFLRNTSLDELPQLFNVLRGDMSLVGNRPLPLYEAETLTTDQHAKRFLAPAGITGLWQIKKRGQSSMSQEERIKLDIDYADKSNLLFDMWIMAHTPQALLQKANT